VSSAKRCKVSIVIPNFNKARYISQTLDSIENQNYQEWEAIVVDDGSTDNSIDIIKEFCYRDMRFRLLKRDREPKGASTCRNIGIESANGEYLIFLDADDLLMSNCLRDRVSDFENHKNLDFLVYPMGTFYKSIGDNSFVWRAKDDNHLQRFLSHDMPWTITSPIWKRVFLLKLQGFDERFPRLQDVELHTRALLNRDMTYKVFSHLPPDSFYRIDEERIIDSYELFIDRLYRGTILYLEKMTQLARSNKKLLRCLNGTLISIIYQILYSFKQNKISKKQKNDSIKILTNSADTLGLLSKIDKLLLKFYIVGYEINLCKIKGFNYIMKKLIIL